MKVRPDGKLDPTDTYDSPWVGSPLDGSQVRLDGGGLPVIGIVGRIGGRGLTGFGIVTQ
jgi:hypothetical protein